MFDAALNFRDAYMEYVPNYPIAAYRVDDEMANNPEFRAFVNVRIAPLFNCIFYSQSYSNVYGTQMLID